MAKSKRNLGKLQPGSRQASDLLPVYISPGGAVKHVATKSYSRRTSRYYDTVTKKQVSRRQRDKAVSGWSSYEIAAQARSFYGPNVTPQLYRRYITEPIDLTPTTPEIYNDYNEPIISAPDFRDDIDSVIERMNDEYTTQRSIVLESEGFTDEEQQQILTQELAELDEILVNRRDVVDDIFSSNEDRLYYQDFLNDWLMDHLDYDSDSDYWSIMYPEK